MFSDGDFLDLIQIKISYFNDIDHRHNYHMIFELADGGSLREHLDKHFDDLTWKDKYELGLEITNGLKYLHELGIIHKDLVYITFNCVFRIRTT